MSINTIQNSKLTKIGTRLLLVFMVGVSGGGCAYKAQFDSGLEEYGTDYGPFGRDTKARFNGQVRSATEIAALKTNSDPRLRSVGACAELEAGGEAGARLRAIREAENAKRRAQGLPPLANNAC